MSEIAPRTPIPTGARWILHDSLTEAMRHLRIIPRSVELLVFSALQPTMFVLLFVYIFGGSIQVDGYSDYTQFLIPGIFAQTMLFNSSFTGVGLAEDLQKGLIERLRSLPISQPAVLVGRTLSDLVRNIISFSIMYVVAFIVGFRIGGSVLDAAGATLLLIGFSHALTWVQALFGLSVGSVEAANSAGIAWMFPLTFVSSAFVDPANMPGWMEAVAEVNPFTVVTDAVRALYNGQPVGSMVWHAVYWTVGIAVVFSTLAIRRFNRATAS